MLIAIVSAIALETAFCREIRAVPRTGIATGSQLCSGDISRVLDRDEVVGR
jgi:hypothetical protein